MTAPIPAPGDLLHVLDAAGIGVCRVGLGELGLWFSSAALELLTGDPDTPLADAAELAGCVYPADRDAVEGAVRKALEEGGSYHVVHRLSRDPRRWVSAYGWVNAEPDQTGFQGLTALHVDITEQMVAEQELRASLDRHRLLLKAAPVGIGIHQYGKVVFVNEAGARMLRWPVEELVGRSALEFVAPEFQAVAAGRIHNALTERDPTIEASLVEQRFICRDGTSLPVLVSGVRTTWRGEPAIQVVFVDLSEQKALEAQLQHSQRLESLGRLAGGVAHDFNNLLTVVLGASEQIGLFSDDPRVQSAVLSIGKAARRGVGITRQLLSFARQRPVKPRSVELAELIRSSRSLLRPLLGEEVALRLELPRSEGLWALIDPVQVDQVLVNLAVNARDAMPEGGSLTITVRRCERGDAPTVELVVQDTGVGMSDEVLEHAFEPFYTTKPVGAGTGLGLSTCIGIVRQAGGTMEVESTVGEGTRFVIRLPETSPPETPEPEIDDISHDASGPRPILVVEDDPLVRAVVAEALRARGYDVSVAAEGKEAMRIAGRIHNLEAVVCDVVLPGPNGAEVLAMVRRRFPHIPALLVSGYAPDRLDPEVLGDHTEFLQKPYTVSQLVAALEELLSGPAGS